MVLHELVGNEVAPKHVLELCPSESCQKALELEGERRTLQNADTRRDIGADEERAQERCITVVCRSAKDYMFTMDVVNI